MNLQEQISRMKSMMGFNESIDKTAGVWDTNEKFEDGSDFKISFKVSDVIDLSKDKPVKEIDPKKIKYNFEGRIEDESETSQRVMKADLSYPILVVKNENGEIFGLLDGTHRLQKALLQLNGHDRFTERDGNYFNYVQPYQHFGIKPDIGINVYSFALEPEEFQPTGAINLNLTKVFSIQVILDKKSIVNYASNTGKLFDLSKLSV